MKLPASHNMRARRQRAFTLVEALITSATLVVVLGSVIMCNLFGLAMATRQQIWMSASDDAAKAISTLMVDIRSAVSLQVGIFSANTFTVAGSTNTQTGNALKVYATTNTTPWTLYYYDSTSNNLVKSNYYGAGQPGDVKLVSANPVTNDLTHPIFSEVDNYGRTLTGVNVAQYSISIYMSFTKLQDPQIVIENGNVVDLYQIITTVSPRTTLIPR